jgi:hypothetical protein
MSAAGPTYWNSLPNAVAVKKPWRSLAIACAFVLLAIPCNAQQRADAPDGRQASLPRFVWKQSLPIRPGDPAINPIGGTEVRELAVFDNKLFAAIGYWMDSEEKNDALPGAQVLRLDSANAQWQIDFELTERDPWQPKLRRYFAFSNLETVRFTTDDTGKALAKPVDLLLAGVWSNYPGLDAYARAAGSPRWSHIPITGQEGAASRTQVRAFIVHRDRTNGAETVFAGASGAIFVGGYSRQTQNIVWNAKPEWQGEHFGAPAAQGRVMSFAECNGKLFATVHNAIYERIDGSAPAWRKIFTADMAGNNRNISGFRGLTAIPNPSGTGEVLLAALEDTRPRIYRIDPPQTDEAGQYRATLELDVASLLTVALGAKTTYAIVAYNKMTKYLDVKGACSRLLMGIEAKTPDNPRAFGKQGYDPRAHFLVRECDGSYSVQQIADAGISPEPALVATRSIVISPFSTEPAGTLYAGGFDANHNPVHNTAWLYKGVPTVAAH